MDKGTILKQLKSVDNPSFFTLGGKEIAKDLQELLTEDETVQGFVEIFEKNIFQWCTKKWVKKLFGNN